MLKLHSASYFLQYYVYLLIFCLESMNGTGGGSAELEAMKQDILREMRKEIAKAKLEIIEGGVT